MLRFTTDGDGWAHVEAASILHILKQEGGVIITLDRELQSWSLAGATSALHHVEECDRNRGRLNTVGFSAPDVAQKIPLGQRQAPRRYLPQRGTNPSYLPKQKAAPHAITPRLLITAKDVTPGHEQTYSANVRGWRIVRGRMADNTPYCLAEKKYGNSGLQFVFDKTDWLIGVQHRGTGNFWGGIVLDGKSDAVEWFVLPSGWSVALVADAIVSQDLSQGRALSAELENRSYSFQLSGSAAAITKSMR